jgi:hypothetical protein
MTMIVIYVTMAMIIMGLSLSSVEALLKERPVVSGEVTKDMSHVCASDMMSFCHITHSDLFSSAAVKCLQNNYAELSLSCQNYLKSFTLSGEIEDFGEEEEEEESVGDEDEDLDDIEEDEYISVDSDTDTNIIIRFFMLQYFDMSKLSFLSFRSSADSDTPVSTYSVLTFEGESANTQSSVTDQEESEPQMLILSSPCSVAQNSQLRGYNAEAEESVQNTISLEEEKIADVPNKSLSVASDPFFGIFMAFNSLFNGFLGMESAEQSMSVEGV